MNNSEDHGSIQPDIAKITATDLADTMSAMTQTMTAMTQTMQELGQAVKTLSSTVAELSKGKTGVPNVEAMSNSSRKNAHPLVDAEEKIADEEEFWETVRDTNEAQMQKTIESWKDELNNILVFAGLFSAVVTAFTVESYTWLQQDPRDASNLLLARISLQLSAFAAAFTSSNTSNSGFINSTAPALSLSEVSSMFTPVSYAFPVNLFWVVSLTLSLVSAFFAIAIQQWLRQLRISPDMPARKAVQLLALRQDSLKKWNVPGFISLLPLFLQDAVVLFFFGLFLLLQSLDVTIAVTFGLMTILSLSIFLVECLPLLSPRCPYKSPAAIVGFLQCAIYPLAVVSIPVIFSFHLLLARISLVYVMITGKRWTSLESALDLLDNFFFNNQIPYVKSFGQNIFMDLSQFWLSREYEHIFNCDEYEQANLERTSLIQTFLSVSSHRLPKLSQSLSRFGTKSWTATFEMAVVQSLSAFREGIKWSNIVPHLALDTKIAPYIRGWLSTRHHRLHLRLLQQRDWTQDTKVSWGDSDALTVFRELHLAVASTTQPFAKHLIQICVNQQVKRHFEVLETVPVCLLLDIVSERNYTLDEDDIAAIYSFSLKFLSLQEDKISDADRYRLVSTATALTLIAVNTARTASTINVPTIINMFAKYLDKDRTRTIAKDDLHWYYRDPDEWSKGYPPFLSPVKIHQALCKALANYASADTLPLDASHLQDLARILEALREVCRDGFQYIDMPTGLPGAENDEARVRREAEKRSVENELDRLDDILSSKNVGLPPIEPSGDDNSSQALVSGPAADPSGTSNHASTSTVDNDSDIPAGANNVAATSSAQVPGRSDGEPKVETLNIVEARAAEETQPASETAVTLSLSGLQAAGDVLSVRVADPEGERTGAYQAAITPEASTTSPTTDKLENIALPRIKASVMPTEDSEPEILSSDRSDNLAQGNDNNDETQDSMGTSMKADESNDTSLKNEEIENTNEPSQVSAVMIPDETHNHEALSDNSATNSESPGYVVTEGNRMAPNDPDTASPPTRPYDDGASPEATAAIASNDSVV